MANNAPSISPEDLPDKPTTETAGKPADDRQAILVNLIMISDPKIPLSHLAKQAGYSDAYSSHINKMLVQTDSFQRALLEAYKGHLSIQLPRCLKIRQRALKKYEDDASLAIDKPKLLESTERIAGVHNEEKARVPTININRLQILMQEMHNQPVKVIEQVPEAEIAEGQLQ